MSSARPQAARAGRVLLVDDVPELRRLLGMVLEAGGFSVIHVESAWAAHLQMPRTIMDVVVVDLLRSDPEGIDLVRWMRRQSGLAHLPVVFMAGGLSDESLQRALMAGADVAVSKPFRVRSLQLIVGRLVKHGRPASAKVS
jgi:DNA-binding response OmpR family regulator